MPFPFVKDPIGYLSLVVFLLLPSSSWSQITLLGDNIPYGNIRDGDFESVKAYWREAKQSPFWKTHILKGDIPMGIHRGKLFSANEIGVAESEPLSGNPLCRELSSGDILNWSFGADLEYKGKGSLSLSLVFGEEEHLLAEKVPLIGADRKIEHFSGSYTLSQKDSQAGLPYVRVVFYSEKEIKVFLDYVTIVLASRANPGPERLEGTADEKGLRLSWNDTVKSNSTYSIYRSREEMTGYQNIGNTEHLWYIDTTIVNGVGYHYRVTRTGNPGSAPSNGIRVSREDKIAPRPPRITKTQVYDTEISIVWDKAEEEDVAYYSIERGDAQGQHRTEIAKGILGVYFEDLYPPKEVGNTYFVHAHDYSGNKSAASSPISARVKTVEGASFHDLILPMPIHKKLSSEVWGAPGVVPRDPHNGIEHPDWSYWGGHPMYGHDGKYHMLVVRWPANGLKGHWEWPNSTVVHTISEQATGPYLPTDTAAYDYKNGLGHNADVLRLNDGRYLLYSLIDWEPTLFTAPTMSGPWHREGIMDIIYDAEALNDDRKYQVERNLSGLQLEDGSLLFISKFGRMIKSSDGLLGPYHVLSDVIQKNETIPERYRRSGYEDPVLWRDEVQFHCLINAFIDKRAIYLRSPDGIHWKFDPGLAYTPKSTAYVDGTRTLWYKLERPHVLQDEYGRATHVSLAALDVPKRDDLPGDEHNSKNIILPLRVHRRLRLLNKDVIDATTRKIKLLIRSEPGFDAQRDINLASLRFGASEEVNFGRGCRALRSKKKGRDLLVLFSGTENGFTKNNFAGKLLGRTKSGELIIGYSKQRAE